MKKRLVSLILVLCIAVSFAVPALAVNADSLEEYTAQAETLKNLGLFLGTDNGFELENGTTRGQSAVMVVRLLGKESEALKAAAAHPFSDVPDWASGYVGYLYANGITTGISDELYGTDNPATASQFGTFLLRALGYSDADGDFTWDASLQKMESLGIITAGELQTFSDESGFLRAYAVALSYKCLFTEMNGSDYCLLEYLYLMQKAFSSAQLSAASSDGLIAPFANLYGIASAPSGERLSQSEIYEACHDAVFKIELFDEYGLEYGSGSGFFISDDGYAITNFHVISSSSTGIILLPDGSSYDILGVLGFDPVYDIALIKVDIESTPYLTLGDPFSLKRGDRVYAIGSPNGVPDTISTGTINKLNYSYKDSTYLESTAPIYPGSSGGALINEYGQVVGVTSAGTEDGSISLAAPITRISELIRRQSVLSLRYFFAHTRYGYIPFGNVMTETGDNDTVAVQQVWQDGIIIGSISDANDVDLYSLSRLNAGTLLVSLTTDDDSGRLLRFDIVDADGNVIQGSQHYDGEAFCLAMSYAAINTTYYVRIHTTDTDATRDVPYELYFVWLPEAGNDMPATFELESNNSAENADYLPLGYTCIASIDSGSDVDYYRIHIERESYLLVLLAPMGGNVSSLSMTLVNAATGKTVQTATNDGEYIYIDTEKLAAGDYYIIVKAPSGVKHDAMSGAYLLLPSAE